jgi:hypothetical protein
MSYAIYTVPTDYDIWIRDGQARVLIGSISRDEYDYPDTITLHRVQARAHWHAYDYENNYLGRAWGTEAARGVVVKAWQESN